MPLRIPICKLDGNNILGESVDLGSDQYARLVQQRGHPTNCRVSDELDELLMAASQQHEQSSQQYETYCTEGQLDELFLEASQLLDIEPLNNPVVVKPSGKQQVDVEPLDNPVVVKPSGKQQVDVEPLDNPVVVKPSGKQQVDVEPLDNPVVVKPLGKRRFGQPQSEKDIQAVKESRVQKKMLQNTGGLKAFGVNGLLTGWSSR